MCARPLYIHRDRDGAEKAGKLDNCSPTSTRSQATRAHLPYLPLPIPIPVPMSIHGRAIQTDTLPAQRSMTSPQLPPIAFQPPLSHQDVRDSDIPYHPSTRERGTEPLQDRTSLPQFQKRRNPHSMQSCGNHHSNKPRLHPPARESACVSGMLWDVSTKLLSVESEVRNDPLCDPSSNHPPSPQ